MIRNRCSKCDREIDWRDFFVNATSGKICSDCLIKAKPVDVESVYLFERRRNTEAAAARVGKSRHQRLEEAL